MAGSVSVPGPVLVRDMEPERTPDTVPAAVELIVKAPELKAIFPEKLTAPVRLTGQAFQPPALLVPVTLMGPVPALAVTALTW